ncbi:MAG: tRNA (guanosine(46)-N7)-methyltransferase TrmB, partial [Gammaproteobacteria bacterium]|nr:tRNA (guanosine(46)-N7)-methyltransferase TrmB [Gammaproteobacteria bacterium]
ERALQKLWTDFGVDHTKSVADFCVIFGREAPVIVEIGFGNGAALAATALAQPQKNFLGIEVHRPGIGYLLRRLQMNATQNVRVLQADANDIFSAWVPDRSLAAVNIFFPDPWPKKRHNKRRLVQTDFCALIQRKLKPGGHVHVATDWRDYAEHMLTVLSQTPGLVDVTHNENFLAYIASRPQTKYEQRGQRLGHEVTDLIFQCYEN